MFTLWTLNKPIFTAKVRPLSGMVEYMIYDKNGKLASGFLAYAGSRSGAASMMSNDRLSAKRYYLDKK